MTIVFFSRNQTILFTAENVKLFEEGSKTR